MSFVRVALLVSKNFGIDLVAIDRASGGAVHRDVLSGPLRAGLGSYEAAVTVLIDLLHERWPAAGAAVRLTPERLKACCGVVDAWVAGGRVTRESRAALAEGLNGVHRNLFRVRSAFGGDA